MEPFSIKHKYDGKWDPEKPELKTCNPSSMKFVTEKDTKQEVKEGEEIIFSYDVAFKVPKPLAFALSLKTLVGAFAEALVQLLTRAPRNAVPLEDSIK